MRLARLLPLYLLFLASVAGCQSLFDPPAARAPAPAYVVPQEYRLGAGDVVSIRIYGGDEEMRLERVRLDRAGAVVLPVGDFSVAGRTTREVETQIKERIQGRLLRNPRVSVNIDEYRPFFVDGQVGRPGAYPFQPDLTVRKALTIAGGLRERASVRKMFVVREGDKSQTPVNVDLNAPVGPGDTINVQESFF